MPRKPYRPLAAAVLAATLLLLTPLPAAAAPADGKAPLSLARLAEWMSQRCRWPSSAPVARQASAKETIPGMDPNGASTILPGNGLLDPNATSAQPAASDGETIPGMDPDG